jgi:excisionase family DNA binding protein
MTLTVPEAARRVGRNPETVRRWIREGRLRAHKVGTQHVIDDADLNDATHGMSLEPIRDPDPNGGPDTRAIVRAIHGGRSARSHEIREAVTPYLQATRGRPAATVDAWLPMIVGRIVRVVNPAKIVLFGSRARGDAREDSDYDLLVIVDAAKDRRALRIAIRRSFDDLAVAADVVVATVEEAGGRIPGRPAGVVYWALQGGQVVYERGHAT